MASGKPGAVQSFTMIEAATVDFDRVQSSTATKDGDRIVLILDAPGGPTNISLPSSEVPRLLTAISTPAGMAKVAQTGKPVSLALPVRSLQVRVHQFETDLL